jgi:CheY-like chemotaxis protein
VLGAGTRIAIPTESLASRATYGLICRGRFEVSVSRSWSLQKSHTISRRQHVRCPCRGPSLVVPNPTVCRAGVSGPAGRLQYGSRPMGYIEIVVLRCLPLPDVPRDQGPQMNALAPEVLTGHVIVADGDPAVVTFVMQTLRNDGHTVFHASDGLSAVELAFALDRCHLVISNTNVDGVAGLELVRQLRHQQPTLPILYLATVEGSTPDIESRLPLATTSSARSVREAARSHTETASDATSPAGRGIARSLPGLTEFVAAGLTKRPGSLAIACSAEFRAGLLR